MSTSALFCGAVAGFVETTLCHPLDTLKTRIQNRSGPPPSTTSWWQTVYRIYSREGCRGFYHGLGVVYVGVVPKNAVRFASFEFFGVGCPVLVAGMLAGATEAVLVVNPMDVLKVRVQAQFHSLRDPSSPSVAVLTILRREGPRILFRGMPLTVLRQSVNQGSNFTVFHWLRNHTDWGPFWAGCCSGAVGPLLNNPLDVVKTRLQASTSPRSVRDVCVQVYEQLGWRGFYRGLGSRLLRIVPGQGITFLVYDTLRRY